MAAGFFFPRAWLPGGSEVPWRAPTGAGLSEFYVPLGSLALMSCCDFTNLSFKERVYKKANRTLKARNIPKLGN